MLSLAAKHSRPPWGPSRERPLRSVARERKSGLKGSPLVAGTLTRSWPQPRPGDRRRDRADRRRGARTAHRAEAPEGARQTSSTSESTPVRGRRKAGDHRALERRSPAPHARRAAPAAPAGRTARRGAARAGRCRFPPVRAAPGARAGSRSALRTARAVRSPSRTVRAPTPDSPPFGARRAIRLQNARSSSSWSARMNVRRRGRPLLPSATGRHTPVSVRVQATGPSA